ncbi:MAG: flagellar assembly protein FliH [Desulfovibrio sp.]|uniref:FliH/SctL family protein n=1 Tax=Desulfovibrio sp. TaxID=885 RepID=UPI00135D2B0A|nr:FliH/SctL family protein [Desulfovibrio sp.]MTJ92371.1 flagellar assembly protein FliH [Desulfovibrio sp.]
MASDQLRKKWGTIFMGEREASPQQLDAMQEPLLRERAQQQHQEDYLARVRARAEERAREILGAAYAERQKVLEEAGAEAQTRILQLTREALALKAQAQEELAQAQAEHGKTRDLREEAEIIRDHAHNDGFQAGMAQAGAELKEFRADVGQMLGNMLQALEAQRHSLGEAWRDELAELARVAVEAGTGWILQAEHQRILQHLVFSSLQLLEDRATVTVRVHPDDEETVGDLFRAARERVPELSQWIVNGDASIEAGGLVAESVSGSVENLRSHYREMVDGILEYLTLPQRPQDEQAEQAAGLAAAQGLAHLAEMMPQEEAPPAEVPATLPPEAEMEQEADADLPADVAADITTDMSGEVPGGQVDDAAAEPIAAGMNPAEHDASADFDVPAPHEGFADPGQQPHEMLQQESLPQPEVQPAQLVQDEQFFGDTPALHDTSPQMAQDIPAADGDFAATPDFESDQGAVATPAVEPELQPAAPAAQHHEAQAANPSLAELEDELFPLPAEENGYAAPVDSSHAASGQGESRPSDSSVFVSGGFLPGSGNG